MAFVIVIRDVGNPHADFYAGGTYQCEREIYPVTALGDMDAKNTVLAKWQKGQQTDLIREHVLSVR